MSPLFVLGAGLWGPGLEGWAASLPVLQGRLDHVWRDCTPPTPTLLPLNERRRTGASVRLALAVALEASTHAGFAPGIVRSVFGTSNGEGPVIHAILASLADPDRQVSPTQFHNSVHNAAAGYWSIAARSQAAATCLGCHDATFAAALLKAVA
ncbi:MAG: beta-ketoacyl synthase chain length factor, partial [Acetobacteraceae bacterium]|nr:beta-ketoacyl synthase chain length factor [Acetobacteraceae bacterium]